MPSQIFDELVKSEQTALKESPFDLADEKARWLRNLEGLYGEVQRFLKPYVDLNQVAVRFEEIELTEEQLGTYSANRMVITIGRKTILLQPIGTFLIGSRGRVDVVGTSGTAQLLLLSAKIKKLSDLIRVTVHMGNQMPPTPEPTLDPSNIEWTWRLLGKPPERKIIELTEDTFLDMLTEISNG
jgi:hypothetical protein